MIGNKGEKMKKIQHDKLLKDRKVIEEINRHLWIQSEKAGYDIGFDSAAEDWLKNFSKAWMDYHMPKRRSLSGSKLTSRGKSSALKKSTQQKQRSSKSSSKTRV